MIFIVKTTISKSEITLSKLDRPPTAESKRNNKYNPQTFLGYA